MAYQVLDFNDWSKIEFIGTDILSRGSVSMGSVGSLESINFWGVGSGTHQLWAIETLNYPLYNKEQTNNFVSNYAMANHT